MSPPRQRGRSGFALALVGLCGLGCERARPAPAPAPIEAPAQASSGEAERRARAEETAALTSWLREQSLAEPRFFAPRVLYTWTREEQIAELRASPVLLTRSRGAGGARSGFDHALDGDPSPLARHLRSERWSARRFAWTGPWATRMGWPGADYGDRLVRVELRPGAWIARLDPDGPGPRWDVRDAAGQEVAEAAVRAEPWRVAAVYHQGRGPGPDGAERVWREYVLVSEPMIARWSVGDDATSRVLARDRAQLAVLANRLGALDTHPPAFEAWTRSLTSRWASEGGGELVSLYESALALGSEHYLPEPAHIVAIARALELPPEAELSHAPQAYAPRRPTLRRPPPRSRVIHCDPTMGCHP